MIWFLWRLKIIHCSFTLMYTGVMLGNLSQICTKHILVSSFEYDHRLFTWLLWCFALFYLLLNLQSSFTHYFFLIQICNSGRFWILIHCLCLATTLCDIFDRISFYYGASVRRSTWCLRSRIVMTDSKMWSILWA